VKEGDLFEHGGFDESSMDLGYCAVGRKAVSLRSITHLSDDTTVAKMGHPALWAPPKDEFFAALRMTRTVTKTEADSLLE
jgi:hypothetical protein